MPKWRSGKTVFSVEADKIKPLKSERWRLLYTTSWAYIHKTLNLGNTSQHKETSLCASDFTLDIFPIKAF